MSHKPTFIVLTAVCAVVGLWAAQSVCAQCERGNGISAKLDVACASRYVWRGIQQTSDWVLQPSLTLSGENGLSLNYWASWDSDKSDVTENDYTLDYSWQARGLSLNAGVIHYAFPNTSGAATSELYLGAAAEGRLSPSLTVNWDFDEADGVYAAVGVSHKLSAGSIGQDIQLSGRVGFSSASYNDYWFGVRSTAPSDLYLGVSVPVKVSTVTLNPSLGYTRVISSKLRRALQTQGLKRDNLILGIATTFEF